MWQLVFYSWFSGVVVFCRLGSYGSDFRLYDGSDLKTYLLMNGRGLMLWLLPGPPCRVYLLDLFSSGIQFFLLLSPYLCFISFLYLDLYVLSMLW